MLLVVAFVAIALYIFIGRCIGIYFTENIPWDELTEEQRNGQVLIEIFWPLVFVLFLFESMYRGSVAVFSTLPRQIVKKIREIRDRRADEKFLRDGK